MFKQVVALLFSSIAFQTYGQKQFVKAEQFIKENIEALGGRAVLMIYKDGKVIYAHSENNISVKQQRLAKFISRRTGKEINDITADFTTSTRERIASSSKWLSAALVMTFVDENKISLDDTIGKFLPVMSQAGKGAIKIRHCLSHLTGIKAPALKESMAAMKEITSMNQAIDEISRLPMEGQPGKTFHYSNVGLQIAGAVIEKISGKSFEQLFAERIAIPCEMKNTDFGKGKVAQPAGGAFSTPEDYLNFLVMILNDGMYKNKRILSKSAVTLMQQNYTKDAVVAYSPAEAGSWGYGFGEWVIEETGNRSTAVTSPGLFGCFPWVDNKNNYAAILFCFNVKSKGRNEKYRELKRLVDSGL